MTVSDVKLINIPKITDVRGNLSVIEKDVVPFSIHRVYYLYDVPSGSYRGGHAHKELHQLLIAISGSFDVILKDKNGNELNITLKRPDQGLLIPHMIWREIEGFSSGAIRLVIASQEYNEDDYIYSLEDFLS